MTDSLQCVSLCWSDNPMDHRSHRTPANPLPLKCDACGMCDLDFVPQPYYLCKGITRPRDIDVAEAGNFLVRERTRKIIEIAAPGQCLFYETNQKRNAEPTGWFLAVPQNQIVMGTVKPNIRRCPKCGEPLHAHGTQYAERDESPRTNFDICKSRNWITTSEKPAKHYPDYFAKCMDARHAMELHRWSFFSLRMELLFKKSGVRGFTRGSFSPNPPTAEDQRWVREKLDQLAGLEGAVIPSSDVWFASYVSAKPPRKTRYDFPEIESHLGAKLPESYKAFALRFGKKRFSNIDGEQGLASTVLTPSDLEITRAKITDSENQSTGGHGIIFADTEFGDFFCFKIDSAKAPDYEVYRYDHEIDDFEPYANDFASCIRGWAEK